MSAMHWNDSLPESLRFFRKTGIQEYHADNTSIIIPIWLNCLKWMKWQLMMLWNFIPNFLLPASLSLHLALRFVDVSVWSADGPVLEDWPRGRAWRGALGDRGTQCRVDARTVVGKVDSTSELRERRMGCNFARDRFHILNNPGAR